MSVDSSSLNSATWRHGLQVWASTLALWWGAANADLWRGGPYHFALLSSSSVARRAAATTFLLAAVIGTTVVLLCAATLWVVRRHPKGRGLPHSVEHAAAGIASAMMAVGLHYVGLARGIVLAALCGCVLALLVELRAAKLFLGSPLRPFISWSSASALVFAVATFGALMGVGTRRAVPIAIGAVVYWLGSRANVRTAAVVLGAAGLVVVPLVPAYVTGSWYSSVNSIAVADRASARPDVLLVIIDTLRADRTSLSHAGWATTPVLEALAAEGVSFASAYSPATATAPSVKALFTAQPASRDGLPGFSAGPAKGVVTLAETMRAHGYATGMFSTNGILCDRPFRRGFQAVWCHGGFDSLRRSLFLHGYLSNSKYFESLRWAERLRLHKLEGDAARLQAARWRAAQNEPTFTYIHIIEPHWPYYDEGHGLGSTSLESVTPMRSSDLLSRIENGAPENAGYLDSPALGRMLELYDEGVAQGDAVLGRILRDLASSGRGDDTLVIVAGDHGEEFFEHLGFSHGHDIYEELSRVPLVLRLPRRTRAGRSGLRVETPVSTASIGATIRDLLSIDESVDSDPWLGQSILRVADLPAARQPIAVEALAQSGMLLGVRDGDIMLRAHIGITGEVSDIRAFDLVEDPGEQSPLPLPLDDVLVQVVMKRVEQVIAGWRSTDGQRAALPPESASDSNLRRLRALGYIR